MATAKYYDTESGTWKVIVGGSSSSGTEDNLTVSTVAPTTPAVNDVWVDTSSDLGAVDLTGSMGVALHGSDASYARPTGYAAITWIGTVQPTNATANDIWYNG